MSFFPSKYLTADSQNHGLLLRSSRIFPLIMFRANSWPPDLLQRQLWRRRVRQTARHQLLLADLRMRHWKLVSTYDPSYQGLV
jgi:hypothetical protein